MPHEAAHRRRVRWTIAAVVAGLALGGRGSDGGRPAPGAPSGSAPTSTLPTSVKLPDYHPKIDPANFTDQVTNPYFPLQRGRTTVTRAAAEASPGARSSPSPTRPGPSWGSPVSSSATW
jgi:hypothetical protein